MDILRGRAGWILLISFLTGCGGVRTGSGSLPIPTPPPISVKPLSTSWTFNQAPGAMQYRISRSAAIESQSDSGSNREISTNATRELITLSPTGDSGTSFTAVIDNFSSTTQGLIGGVQPIQVPVELSGMFDSDSLVIRSTSSTDKCDPVSSAIVSDLHNLLPRFPTQLTQGFSWRDSVRTAGCQAAIPTNSRLIRSYLVAGEAMYEGRPVLLVQRSDSIQAHGEGAQQQHQLKLDASGTGNGVYYLDTTDGRIVRLTTVHDLSLTITASGKAHHFKQRSTQDFRLAP